MTVDVGPLVDEERAVVSRRIFADEAIYQEMEQIYGHWWLMLGHESQLRHPKDFFTSGRHRGRAFAHVWIRRDGLDRRRTPYCHDPLIARPLLSVAASLLSSAPGLRDAASPLSASLRPRGNEGIGMAIRNGV